MGRLRVCAVLAAVIAASVYVSPPTTASTPWMERVSVSSSGTERNRVAGLAETPQSAPAISADGQVLVFESDSDNLVPGDTNKVPDIFVRAGGVTSRINGFGGAQPDGRSSRPAVSADGNLVVFESEASNLVAAGDTNGAADIYLYDRIRREMTRVSAPKSGEEPGVAANNPSISGNGQWIAFDSAGFFDLTTPPSPGVTAIYKYRVSDGWTQLMTRIDRRLRQGLSSARDTATSWPSWDPSVSDQGDIAFVSRARDLTYIHEPEGSVASRADDVFLVFSSFETYKLSDPWQDGRVDQGAEGHSYEPVISAHGNLVAFTSTAENMYPTYDNGQPDVWAYDGARGTVHAISVRGEGLLGDGPSHSPAVSADGDWVAFTSGATNLVAGDTNGRADIFLHDRDNFIVSKVSGAAGGDPANGASSFPALAGTGPGQIVAFQSLASNLVPGDSNHVHDTFVRNLNVAVPPPDPDSDLDPASSTTATTTSTGSSTTTTTTARPATVPTTAPDLTGAGPGGPGTATGRSGYWMVAADGTVYRFGDATWYGNAPVGAAEAVDIEPSPSGNGYWIVDNTGRTFAFGDADRFGNLESSRLRRGEQVTSLSARKPGEGYLVFTSAGRVFAIGPNGQDERPGVGHLTLNGPVLDSVVTPSADGYYMVASDGGIFTFGDAAFHGSMGDQKLNAPVQSLVPDRDGDGYWLVASDGGVFAFRADFRGSMGATRLNRPVTGMVRAGTGYLMVGEDGGIFDFSGDPTSFKGSLGANPPARPITAVALL